MNIKLIKAEIEKLSLMLSSWEGEESVSAIERDIALDKLKKIYDLVRFDSDIEEPAPIAEATAVPVTEPTEEKDEETLKESDVEVELIFADEEDFLSTLPDAVEQEEEPIVETSSLVGDILASAMTVPVVMEDQEAEKDNDEANDSTPVEEQPEPEVEESVISEPQEEQTPAQEKPAEEKPAEDKQSKHEEPKSLNNLFGLEEVQRRPRTKHQRMMSIYNDSESRPEKVVDISKIFDLDIDAPKPLTTPSAERKPEPAPAPRPTPAPKPAPIEEEHRVTIADAMAGSTHTLADTIAAPSALAEEMHHSKIASLRDGIGLNDKFLMIRDLFDGDGEAYDEAIAALDSMETMDDCMIHIIENYAWNPDTEGSKFIMQLLERKLS